MTDDADLIVGLARALAWATLFLIALMLVSMAVLRSWRRYQQPRQALFLELCTNQLMRYALGEDTSIPISWRSSRHQWALVKVWLRLCMSLRGLAQQKLAQLGCSLKFQAIAHRRLNSRQIPDRLIAMLILGHLRHLDSVPLLRLQLRDTNSMVRIHACRALMDIGLKAHVSEVVHTLLTCDSRDDAQISVLLKPFRSILARALMALAEHADIPRVRWLQLAHAVRAPLPSSMLAPYLHPDQSPDCLMAALRLVQGETGAAALLTLATHGDWRVRVQVARALSRIATRTEIPVLLKLITDPQWWVRYRAAQALLDVAGLSVTDATSLVSQTGDRYAIDMLNAAQAERKAYGSC